MPGRLDVGIGCPFTALKPSVDDQGRTAILFGYRLRMSTIFPLEEVEQTLRQWGAAITRAGDVLRWPHGQGTTELRVGPSNVTALDGSQVAETVTLVHRSPALTALSGDQAVVLNAFVCMSALVPEQTADGESIVLSAKLSIFRGDDVAAKQLYAPLIATEAYMSAGHAQLICSGALRQDPAYFGLSGFNDLPPCHLQDFQEAKDVVRGRGLYANAGNDGFAAEFPWDRGAVSRIMAIPGMADQAVADGITDLARSTEMGGRTSLFTISTRNRHPYYGNGLLARLELPLSYKSDEIIEICTRLNAWEQQSPDLPPSLGAWCRGESGSPCFVTFIPNELCMPGLPHTLAVWAGHRAYRVHYFLGPDQ